MIRVNLSVAARQDVRDIANFTAGVWGEEQAVAYRDRLIAAGNLLALYPEIGKRLPRLGPSVRRVVHESHVIVYERVSDDEIEILRVVHVRRRLSRRLLTGED